MASQKKKKLVGAGIALALMAGVTAGGAFISQSSTIADNKFRVSPHETGPWIDGALKVTGDPMEYIFSGTVADESITRTYKLQNLSSEETLRVDLGSEVKSGDRQEELARELGVSAAVANANLESIGTVSSMKLGNTITLAPGASTNVTLKVDIRDEESFREAKLETGARAVVDFQFDSILVPKPE